MSDDRERISVTADARRLGVSIRIGDVGVTIAGPSPVGPLEPSGAQVRQTALRLAARALEVAQQEVRQEQP